jgi:hypothetical protein
MYITVNQLMHEITARWPSNYVLCYQHWFISTTGTWNRPRMSWALWRMEAKFGRNNFPACTNGQILFRVQEATEKWLWVVLATFCKFASLETMGHVTPWPESRVNYTDRATAPCRRSYFQFLRIEGCSVVSSTDTHGRILCFLNWSRYCIFQVAPHLYSRGWVDPVPDPLLLRKSGSAGNRTRTSRSVARNSDH